MKVFLDIGVDGIYIFEDELSAINVLIVTCKLLASLLARIELKADKSVSFTVIKIVAFKFKCVTNSKIQGSRTYRNQPRNTYPNCRQYF